MNNIYISDYEILSSQGDLAKTVNAIKNNTITIDKKIIVTDIQTIEAPYFLLKDTVAEKEDEIYFAIKQLAHKILSRLDDDEISKTTLIIGASLIDLHITKSIDDSVYEGERKPYHSTKSSIDSYAKKIASEFGLNNFTMTINTACTSSANAILEGANLLQADIFKNILVIGAEIYSPKMGSGFAAMDLLSKKTQKPFEEKRDGLVLGEGLAAVLINKQKSSWQLLGGFSNCNAISITGVSESGEEYIEVMKKAFVNAHVCKKTITAIKTHATSTPASDLSEMNAMDELFDILPPLSALKPYLGHTVGACGTLELAMFIACIDDGFIPKLPSSTKHKKCDAGIFLLNYFGFGGNNTSLIIKKE